MEKWIVILAVGLAVVYIVRRIWLTMTAPADDVCGCGCSGCGAASTCGAIGKDIQGKNIQNRCGPEEAPHRADSDARSSRSVIDP